MTAVPDRDPGVGGADEELLEKSYLGPLRKGHDHRPERGLGADGRRLKGSYCAAHSERSGFGPGESVGVLQRAEGGRRKDGRGTAKDESCQDSFCQVDVHARSFCRHAP